MKIKIFFWLLIVFFENLNAQTVYTGFIGSYPIEMVLDSYSKTADATYSYTNFDEPIQLNDGIIKNGKLIFQEKEGSNKKLTTAIFTIDNYSENKSSLEGNWKDVKNNNELRITLSKKYSIENGENIEWKDRELIQPISLGNKYFKIVLSKRKDSYYSHVSAVKIFEKKTDQLLQVFDVECQLWGLNNISVDDYNFDGIQDFSVFEASYAGPNTSSLYFLFDKKTQKYYESGFSGISLEFNHTKKRIYERNQCCAGTIVTTAEYKIVDDSMVLLNQHCFRWNDKKNELTERKMKECQ